MSETKTVSGPPGFVSVTLAKPWLDFPIGEVVWVDPERGKWLAENSYLASPAAPPPPFDTRGSLGSIAAAVAYMDTIEASAKKEDPGV